MQADGVIVGKADGVARVRVLRQGGCGRCSEPGGCGNASDSRCDEFVVSNALALEVNPGDRVRIEIPEGAALRAAALAYGLPLAGVVFGASCGFMLAGSDAASAAGALAGMIAGLVGLRVFRRKGATQPRIAEVL